MTANHSVIEINALTRHFGVRTALDNVSLAVPRGIVFGLVGANGAGKTTLIKHVLGLLKAEAGTVRVSGVIRSPTRQESWRIGYVSEEHDLPGWMKVAELMRYTQAFFPKWDPAYAEELRGRFELDHAAVVGNLSKGQRARAGLLVALAVHRPELLVLDEPSAGLDPIVRRDILEAIIRAIAEDGRTVLFSSHLLHEVERVSDHVTMINQGRIVFSAPLDDIKATHRCLTLRFAQALAGPPKLAGVLAWEGAGHEWTAVYHGQPGDLQTAAASCGAQVLDKRVPSLDEIFVARVGTRIPATVED